MYISSVGLCDYTFYDYFAVTVVLQRFVHTVGKERACGSVIYVSSYTSVQQERYSQVFPSERTAQSHQEVGLAVTDIYALGRVDNGISVLVDKYLSVGSTHIVLA